MKAVFLDRQTLDAQIDLSPIAHALDSLDCHLLTSPDELIGRVQDYPIVITNKVVFDRAVLSKLPNLKLICVAATGMNNIDLQAAKEHGVQVSNVSEYSTYSVAQHVFAYLLDVMNSVLKTRQANAIKPWHQSQTFCQFQYEANELVDRTMGIVGFGAIGQAVANIAKAFGMKVMVAERKNATKIREGRHQFETVIANADVLSIHCPLTEETENLINSEALSAMKQSSILINSARGPIIASDALAKALKTQQIKHAIIDVLETEPPSAEHPLNDKTLANLTLTHHIAWGSMQAQQRLVSGIAQNIRNFIDQTSGAL